VASRGSWEDIKIQWIHMMFPFFTGIWVGYPIFRQTKNMAHMEVSIGSYNYFVYPPKVETSSKHKSDSFVGLQLQ
jgi:hypothetical protein